MRIGIDCRMIGTRHGGIGRYVLELVRGLLALDNNNEYFLFYNQIDMPDIKLRVMGNELRVDASKPVTSHLSPATFVPVNIRHYSLMEQLKFGRILEEYDLDLVHFPNFNVPLMYKKPFVVTIHDMVHHKISGHKKSRLPHFWAYKKIIQNAANRAKKIITVSNAAKTEIVRYLNIPGEKITVTYEGVSLEDDVSSEDLEENKKRFLLNRPYFLFVGVLERKKNIVNLARGFEEFLSRFGLDMDLVIVGREDKHYPEIKQHALQIPHSSHLIFTGEVSERQLKALYKGAHAFVSASMHEGFGLPGVEAMKFGLPLVVSNTAVFNEIYDNAAVYFDGDSSPDIAEKLHIVARDENFHRQMQEKSFNRGQMFSWKKTAEETLKVYASILTS